VRKRERERERERLRERMAWLDYEHVTSGGKAG
jgi:hypothetical protein